MAADWGWIFGGSQMERVPQILNACTSLVCNCVGVCVCVRTVHVWVNLIANALGNDRSHSRNNDNVTMMTEDLDSRYSGEEPQDFRALQKY